MSLFHSTSVVLLFVPTSIVDEAQASLKRRVDQNRHESKGRFVEVMLFLPMLATGLYGEILRHVS